MQVIHLTTSVSEQSACKRINDAIRIHNIQSRILTLNSNYCSEVMKIKSPIINKILNRIEYTANKHITKSKSDFISTSWHGNSLIKNKEIINSDVIHIHWVNGGFLGLKNIDELLNSGKKIVWTVHDSWPFTSICHVRNRCNNYKKKSCISCPHLKNQFSFIPQIIWKRKKEMLTNKGIRFVFPSKQHYIASQESELMYGNNKYIISNPINTDIFNDNSSVSNKIKNKVIIGFGAIGGIKNRYKGFVDLKKAILSINDKNTRKRLKFIIFGSNNHEEIYNEFEHLGIEVESRGYIRESKELRDLYSEMDIFISPSLEESFGQTIAESMACGCIAIGYNMTGVEDIIDHMYNGYLAKNGNVEDLKNGISWALLQIEKGFDREKSSIKISDRFNMDTIGEQYIKLYKM